MLMVVFANARTYATGAVINPNDNISDGVFEIVIVRKINVFELLRMLLVQKSFKSDNIEIIQTKNVEIIVHKKSFFQVDGEYRGKFNRVIAKIDPAALKILLPTRKQTQQG